MAKKASCQSVFAAASAGNQLVLLDFGLVAKIDRKNMQRLATSTVHLVQGLESKRASPESVHQEQRRRLSEKQ